jgi:transcription elongation factor GreA
MAKFQYYTQEKFDELKAELQYLKTVGRADMSAQIAEARDKGDLSENAEYDAAKDAQGLLEMRISKMENIVAIARVIDETNVDNSIVSILSKVKIKNVKNGMEKVYTIVSEEEADLAAGKISNSSPFGKGLFGKKVGDVAQIQAPVGAMEFEIIEITR